ncbi:MAG: hypothetical protein Q4P12_05840, partial [Bacteroidales bacterium]|nr:hypothetical protein [Bacteroidales bacterium]
MTNPIKDGKQCILSRVIVMYLCMANRAFRTVSPEGAIYRAGSLTLSFCPVVACHVSNPERVIQHKALWSEVPLDIIDALLQPAAFENAPPKHANRPTSP